MNGTKPTCLVMLLHTSFLWVDAPLECVVGVVKWWGGGLERASKRAVKKMTDMVQLVDKQASCPYPVRAFGHWGCS